MGTQVFWTCSLPVLLLDKFGTITANWVLGIRRHILEGSNSAVVLSGWPEWRLQAAVPCKANIVIMGGGVPAPGQHCTASTLHKLSHYPGPWPILSQGTGAEAGCCTGGGGPSSRCQDRLWSSFVAVLAPSPATQPGPHNLHVDYTWIRLPTQASV